MTGNVFCAQPTISAQHNFNKKIKKMKETNEKVDITEHLMSFEELKRKFNIASVESPNDSLMPHEKSRIAVRKSGGNERN